MIRKREFGNRLSGDRSQVSRECACLWSNVVQGAGCPNWVKLFAEREVMGFPAVGRATLA